MIEWIYYFYCRLFKRKKKNIIQKDFSSTMCEVNLGFSNACYDLADATGITAKEASDRLNKVLNEFDEQIK